MIMNLEPGVDTEELPKGWPTVTRADETFAFGLCNLPRIYRIRAGRARVYPGEEFHRRRS
jgi:hypothetical protein